jgi:hypothetical protein
MPDLQSYQLRYLIIILINLPHCTRFHTVKVDIQGLTDSSLDNFSVFGQQQMSTRYKGGNGLPLAGGARN